MKQTLFSLLMALSLFASFSAYSLERKQGFKNPYLFGVLEGGVANLSSDFAREGDKDGYQLAPRLALSWYTDQWVFDFGAGWSYIKLEGDDTTTTGANLGVKTIQSSGIVDLGARYRINENWQVGLMWDHLFGTDLSFASIVLDQKDWIMMAGPRVTYEWNDDPALRIAAFARTDLNVSDRNVMIFGMAFEFGFDWLHQGDKSEPKEEVGYMRNPEPIIEEEAKPDVLMNLDLSLIRFATGSSALSSSSKQMIQRVSEYLVAQNESWDRLLIDGHADPRGSKELNLRLSTDRAKSILDEMVANGVDAEKLEHRGFGSERLLDFGTTEDAYLRNRRVELRFFGVRDGESFEAGLRKTVN